MMRLHVDTNILLDVFLLRQPWVVDSAKIWQSVQDGQNAGFVAASGVTDIFYIVRRAAGSQKAFASVGLCLTTFEICPVDDAILNAALAMPGADFGDNVQIACALRAGADAIVTRDPSGFAWTRVPVLTPAQVLAQMTT